MLLTKDQLNTIQLMPQALVVELRFSTLLGYDDLADTLIQAVGENAARIINQDFSHQGLGHAQARGFTYTKIENFVSRTIRVQTRVPSSIANMTRSFCLDYLKNQSNLIALQGPLKSQLNAFTFKVFLVQDQFKLTPIYQVPTEEGTVMMRMARK